MRASMIVFASVSLFAAAATAAELKPGQASGTYVCNGVEVQVNFASTYMDKTGDAERMVLILSNQKVVTTGWDSGSDFMNYRLKNPILGVAFWFDADRRLVRAAYFDEQSMPLGGLQHFDVALDPNTPTALSGSAHSTEAAGKLKDPISLNVTFHALLP
jgi:hypothetical protein